MTGFSHRRWIKRMIRHRYWLLGFAAVLGIAAAFTGRGLRLDRSIESMFAPDDPLLVPYHRLQRTFGEYEVVLAMYADKELATPKGIERVKSVQEQLNKVPGVAATVSLHDVPGGTTFEASELGDRYREVFSGYTHNEELTAAGVICLIERPGPEKPSRRVTLRGMREVVAELPRGALVGEPVLIEEAFDLLEQDGRRLNTWCTLLVMLTILACFRSPIWLLLPLAVVQLTLALTDAVLVLSGLELSMVSSMLGAIVTVVGVASVVHVLVHYLDERRDGHGRRRALFNTIDQLAAPVSIAIFTDAAGFAALMVSKVGPVHDFGLMMAIGSLLVLPSCILLTPGLVWMSDYQQKPQTPSDELALGRWLNVLLNWSSTHIRWLAAGAVVLVAVSMWGSNRLVHETDFTKNFRADSEINRAYGFVESEFGGAGVWDLMIPVPEENDARTAKPPKIDARLYVQVLNLEGELQSQTPELSKAISLSDTLAAGVGGASGLASTGDFALRMGLGAARARMPQFVDALFQDDPQDGRWWLHVLLRAPEQLSADEKASMIEEVRTITQEKFPDAEVTGYYVLMTRLIESVLADQWKAFIVATIVVLAMMIVAIRDIRLTAVTMFPNIFPSLILFGVMGILGLKVNMGAAMIAAVSIGMSVDSSIHYTMFYQRLRREGLSCNAALAKSQSSVGRAAVYSTLALTVGFATLGVSDFVPTIYFGVLVSLSMIGGLIGNLLILPVLIRLVDGDQAAAEGVGA
ncbi:efflux RND transporter permease subunit [Lacipirellula sp.]|uniref:efflux RND transporter permease subunit n=1 Tax=Lacipirellula sp. TaxID=2691419 RepID=UPI003D13FF3F